ncbi:MAG: hypothetical protein MJ237_09030 [bacterium]|nr:hypothetical protein [bacterium]
MMDFNSFDSYIDAIKFFESIGIESNILTSLFVTFSEKLKHLNGSYKIMWSKSNGYDSHIDVDIDALYGRFHPNFNSSLQQMIFRDGTLIIKGVDKLIGDYELKLSTSVIYK